MATTTEALNSAVRLHQAGHLQQAEQLYREILRASPQHADALLLLGMLLRAQGRSAEAVDCYKQALQVRPDYVEAHNNLGNALRDLGELDEAFACYQRAVELKPDHAEAQNNLGVAFRDRGQWEDAAASCRRALQINQNYPEAHFNLGRVLKEQGQVDEAARSFQQAIRLKADYAEAHKALGTLLAASNHFAKAEASYRRALKIKPDDVEAYNNLANVLAEQGKFDEAEGYYRHALKLQPLCAEVHSHLGNALAGQGRLEDAVASYQLALEINPEYAEAHVNLGKALRDQGKLDAAITSYQHALKIQPDSAQAHFNQSVVLLLRGDFEQSWTEYEWRWEALNLPSPQSRFSQPLWDGSALAGRTIVVWEEQGLGDTLQFIRYAQVLAEQGGKVIARVNPRLHRLLESTEGIACLVGRDADLPGFDCHTPLLSLPRLLRTCLDNIPASTPYLRSEKSRAERWRAKLNGLAGRGVGLCWQGRKTHGQDRLRSIALDRLAPLLATPDVDFVSLQKGDGREQLATADAGGRIADFGDEMDAGADAFVDTAAIIENLDLVITVDTAVAHLAGAMGKPTWVLLSFVPDWRWMLDRRDSPWYRSLRLFRQPAPNAWEPVIEQVATELNCSS